MNLFGSENDDETTRAARLVEDTLRALGLDPEHLSRPAPSGGKAWSMMRGSAAIAVLVRPPREGEESPFLRVISPIVVPAAGNELALYRRLLELNASGLGSASFGLHDGRIVVVSERPTRDLDPGEVRYILQTVGAIADHYDDALVKLFGGQKVSEKSSKG